MSEEETGMEVILFTIKSKNNNNLEETLGNKCINYNISATQRAMEVALGKGTIGTVGYEMAGCFECEGYNLDCKFYVSNFEAFGDAVEEYLK